jgi:hypothetical protein
LSKKYAKNVTIWQRAIEKKIIRNHLENLPAETFPKIGKKSEDEPDAREAMERAR